MDSRLRGNGMLIVSCPREKGVKTAMTRSGINQHPLPTRQDSRLRGIGGPAARYSSRRWLPACAGMVFRLLPAPGSFLRKQESSESKRRASDTLLQSVISGYGYGAIIPGRTIFRVKGIGTEAHLVRHAQSRCNEVNGKLVGQFFPVPGI